MDTRPAGFITKNGRGSNGATPLSHITARPSLEGRKGAPDQALEVLRRTRPSMPSPPISSSAPAGSGTGASVGDGTA